MADEYLSLSKMLIPSPPRLKERSRKQSGKNIKAKWQGEWLWNAKLWEHTAAVGAWRSACQQSSRGAGGAHDALPLTAGLGKDWWEGVIAFSCLSTEDPTSLMDDSHPVLMEMALVKLSGSQNKSKSWSWEMWWGWEWKREERTWGRALSENIIHVRENVKNQMRQKMKKAAIFL